MTGKFQRYPVGWEEGKLLPSLRAVGPAVGPTAWPHTQTALGAGGWPGRPCREPAAWEMAGG